MSAKALTAYRFEPASERSTATNAQTPEGVDVVIQFRGDLWREYRLEAVNAGLSATQATEYASALSPELGLVVGVFESAPVGRGWFYQSRIQVLRRTLSSGLIEPGYWGSGNTPGRSRAGAASIFAPGFRPWKAGGKN